MKRLSALLIASAVWGCNNPAYAQSLTFGLSRNRPFTAVSTPIKSGPLLPANLAPTWSWCLNALAASDTRGITGVGCDLELRKSWNLWYVGAGLGMVTFTSSKPQDALVFEAGVRL